MPCSGAVPVAAGSLAGKTGDAGLLCFASRKVKQSVTIVVGNPEILENSFCSDAVYLLHLYINKIKYLGRLLPALSHFILAG